MLAAANQLRPQSPDRQQQPQERHSDDYMERAFGLRVVIHKRKASLGISSSEPGIRVLFRTLFSALCVARAALPGALAEATSVFYHNAFLPLVLHINH